MDDDDRESNASSENEPDELMEEADDVDMENEAEEEEPEEEPEEEEEQEPEEQEPEGDTVKVPHGRVNGVTAAAPAPAAGAAGRVAGANTGGTIITTRPRTSASSLPPSYTRLVARPEALTARLYDIVPTMAAPQSTSINALAVTPDLRYWMTGGSDGYVRKYDGVGTINGKQLLTVAQRHPFVDSVVKAGILMSYWENEEPQGHAGGGGSGSGRGGGGGGTGGGDDHTLSPVYSLAVHSQALWLLAGTESGGINLQSVRHDEGKRIACLLRHTSAVSALLLAPDEKSVVSGSWDKNMLDWDLNAGSVRRQFDGNMSQIAALEPRPADAAPILGAAGYYGNGLFGTANGGMENGDFTFSSSNGRPLPNGVMMNGVNGGGESHGTTTDGTLTGGDNNDSPAHESLFGSPGGSLFGDNDDSMAGGNPFGEDNETEFSQTIDVAIQGGTTTNGAADDASHPASDATMQDPGSGPEDRPAPPVRPLRSTVNGDATSRRPPPSSSHRQPQHEETGPASTTSLVFGSQPPAPHLDPTQASDSTFFSASIDGTIRIWDRRVSLPVASIATRPGVPPWCMGGCWSPDGNIIYAGRRNGTVEEFHMHKAVSPSRWEPERVLRFPQGSGAISAVRAMANGRHLVCASHDILRLYDLQESAAFKHSSVPFLIIPGPPKAGVISHLYIDPTSRFMISTAGTRGWEGTSTEVLIGYEIASSGG